jgi:hypothetical protein
VARAEVATIPVLRDAVAVVAATLLQVAVFGLPILRTMLLPDLALFSVLHALPLLCRPAALLSVLLRLPVFVLVLLLLLSVLLRLLVIVLVLLLLLGVLLLLSVLLRLPVFVLVLLLLLGVLLRLLVIVLVLLLLRFSFFLLPPLRLILLRLVLFLLFALSCVGWSKCRENKQQNSGAHPSKFLHVCSPVTVVACLGVV